MQHLNIEIKARCAHPNKVKQILEKHQADFKGIDHQIDTYFNVPKGRLKLREGHIENNLIHYNRPNTKTPKASHVTLFQTNNAQGLKTILIEALGTKVVVDKKRAIYFIDNVKFHLDQVQQLGSFVEIEAIDSKGSIGQAHLLQQCQHYMELFGITESDLVHCSYSDLLLEKNEVR